MSSRTVSQYIVDQLEAWGVERIYGVAGDAILPLLDALGKQKKLTYIRCRHESAAAMMASAEAKLTRKPAVCMATSGPGTVNLLNGLADAHIDRVPVIALTGQVETHKLGGNYKQYIDQQHLLGEISHYSANVANPLAMRTVLHRAFVTASQRKGVTHVSICKDVFQKLTDLPLLDLLPQANRYVQGERTDILQGLDLLQKAKRPVFLLGAGTRDVSQAVLSLAEKLGAGIVLTLGAKGVVPGLHPQVLGSLGEGGSKATVQALTEADMLVIFGATWFPRSFIPQGLSMIQVDENPEAFHAIPSLHPVAAKVDEVLPVWSKRLVSHTENSEWLQRVHELHQSYLQEWSTQHELSTDKVRPETVIRILEETAQTDAIIALDTGEHTVWFNRVFHGEKHLPLFSGKWRTMGFGLPAAISAKLCSPHRQVVAVVGDGGLMMNMGELMTARETGAAITVIVLNNGTLGLEEVKMKQEGFTPFGTRLENPQFDKLAQAFGWKTWKTETEQQLREALAQAFANREPALIEVMCTLPTLTPIAKEIILQTQA